MLPCAGFDRFCAVPEEPPTGPTITGFSCVSRTGNGTLRGWSRFADEDDGDWNLRKFRRCDYAQASPWVISQLYTSGCGVYRTDLLVGSVVQATALWDVATNAASQEHETGTLDCAGATTSHTTDIVTDPPWSLGLTETNLVRATYVQTRDIKATGACTNLNPFATVCGFAGPNSTLVMSAIPTSHTLSEPDSVAAAQDRGSPTIGSACETEPGTIDPTSPGNKAELAFTGVRSVAVTISCANLTDGLDYSISATLTKRDASTNALIGTETATITFTADGTTDTVDYDVPIETDVKVEFTSADSITAV